MRVADSSVDTFKQNNIFKLEQNSNKNLRYLNVGSHRTLGGTKAADIEFISFDGRKYGKSSYLIEIGTLPGGEFAITLDGSSVIFNMFGVD